MLLPLAIAGLLVAVGPANAGPVAPLDAYREARERAGRSPDDQVRLALWCEAHGLPAERLKHLALAVLADPTHPAARALLGLVARDGRWQRPEAVAEASRADAARVALLAEYDGKRMAAPYTADGQMALGLWADERGLMEQARAHLTAAVRLDPSREAAWKRLGYRKHEGRWTTDARLAAERAELDAQKTADKHWKVTLERLKGQLDQPSKRDEALATLDAITDPRAVPSIARVFVTDHAGDQIRAVRLLGQVEGPAASRTLAALAVFARSGEIRRTAVETLKGRDPRDFVRLWIALIRKPIRYEVKPVGGPGSPGVLFVEGQKADLRRTYAPPAMPNLPSLAGGAWSTDANGLPVVTLDFGRSLGFGTMGLDVPGLLQRERNQQAAGLDAIAGSLPQNERVAAFRSRVNSFAKTDSIASMTPDQQEFDRALPNMAPAQEQGLQIPLGEMIRETQIAAAVAQRQLTGDVASLDRSNELIHRSNDPILVAMKAVTGGDRGEDPEAWSRWWTDREGYAVTENPESTKPTIFENIPLAYAPSAEPLPIAGPIEYVRTAHHACFAAGTTVRTIEGDRAIESIRTGDLVLVQDTRGGPLSYQPIVAVFHNPPNATFRVALGGGEAVTATGIHRFWKAGHGWAMARDLKAGDVLRTLGGVATVERVEPARVQPVFNLEVAEGRSYFVGKLGALVHDNSPVEAVPHPFDASTAK